MGHDGGERAAASRAAGRDGTTADLAAGQRITIAVVEELPLFREALVRTLDDPPALTVVQAVGTPRQLDVNRAAADVVLVDHQWSVTGGDDVLGTLLAAGTLVIVLVTATGPVAVVEAMAAGVRGYLPRSASGEQVRWVVRTVGRGGTYLAPSLRQRVVTCGPERGTGPAVTCLTRREQDVLRHVAEGGTDQEVAAALRITISTVRSYLDRIRAKTGRRRRADLTRLALAEGIVEPQAAGSDGLRIGVTVHGAAGCVLDRREDGGVLRPVDSGFDRLVVALGAATEWW